MSLTKEYFDYQAYLPEEEVRQLEFIGLSELFKSQWGVLDESDDSSVALDLATPLKPLSNEVFVRL
ncbi:hypothetical protein [Bdellovibrio sp. NC01]|uniref:hypothetical protein n=1 Tax=Bdellovibrio sp. NC01 TaxID=2220073 RepID=UPI00115B708C|nr:hypothetical protein [Bdellovibrio sp. NC01]QDK37945.1 hypothetical protein DOE51_10280 [Bdellovibrio sp. NC01]